MVTYLTLKEKILSFLSEMGIRKVDFFEKTGIQSSNFKGINVKSAPGGDMLVKILTIYPELSAEWLMRGEGGMLRNSENLFTKDLTESDPTKGQNYIPQTTPIEALTTQESKKIDNNLPPSALSELVTTIREQAEEIGRLKARIEELGRERPVPAYAHSTAKETVDR